MFCFSPTLRIEPVLFHGGNQNNEAVSERVSLIMLHVTQNQIAWRSIGHYHTLLLCPLESYLLKSILECTTFINYLVHVQKHGKSIELQVMMINSGLSY